MLREIKNNSAHYYVDAQDHKQGEYKAWSNGQLRIHCFFVKNKIHGEFKSFWNSNTLLRHCFYINGCKISFEQLAFPETPEDRFYFTLKHNLTLLPLENKC